jgi:hypothetical protein
LNEEREVNETGMPVSILFLSGVLAELGSTPIAPFVAAFPQGKIEKDWICDLKLVVYF